MLPDGYTVDGQASYTRTKGTTGIAAAVTLASDALGYILKQTVTHNADGFTTARNKALQPDGFIAEDTIRPQCRLLGLPFVGLSVAN